MSQDHDGGLPHGGLPDDGQFDGGSVEPEVLDVPVGLDATGTRTEYDSLGPVQVPADRYWGAQTQRSLEHFAIGTERMPLEVYHAYGLIKAAAARVNGADGRLPQWKSELIARVGREVAAGELDDNFPLHVWQTGSGTQTNMNVNEVIANRCIQLVGGELGSRSPIHPNDDVNMSQSSNDTFPTAMHVAAHKVTTGRTLPGLKVLQDALATKSGEWADVVKIGRTHLQDATPLTVGQEWSGYAAALAAAITEVEQANAALLHLAIGGTAVGTGLNAPADFGSAVASELATATGADYAQAPNLFAAISAQGPMVRAHAALKGAAVVLFKIANDLRWLGSGPRTGLMELHLPANEPGSSIMPGKVNPTQAEALLMACTQVFGNDAVMTVAGAEGNLELNTFRPVAINAYLQSARILGDSARSFTEYLVQGTALNLPVLERNVQRSVMLITALSPLIGYDRVAAIVHRAVAGDLPLRQAALSEGVSAELYDAVVVPLNLTTPGAPDDPE